MADIRFVMDGQTNGRTIRFLYATRSSFGGIKSGSQMYQVEGLNLMYVHFILFEDISKSLRFNSILNFAILSEF